MENTTISVNFLQAERNKKIFKLMHIFMLIMLIMNMSMVGVFFVAPAAYASDINSECNDHGFDAGIAKWEWNEDAYIADGSANGTNVIGDNEEAYWVSASSVGGVLRKSGQTYEIYSGGIGGTVTAGTYSISHLTFCGECVLEITKSDNIDEVYPGGEIIYHLTLENIGSANCTGGGVKLKDIFDGNTSYISSSPTPNTLSSTYIEWNFGTIEPGEIEEVDLTMGVSEEAECGSVLVNRAKYWSNQTEWSDEITEETTVVCDEPECGDAEVNQQHEECDLGDDNGIICEVGYGETCEYCSDICTLIEISGPFCGDLVKNGEEECDGEDGVDTNQVCNENCEIINLCLCGNGDLDSGEECDDGNNEDGDGCSATCTLEPTCGDGEVNQQHEECDLEYDNGLVCEAGYGETCTYCTFDCTEEEIAGPFCGDEIKNGDEECDTEDGVEEHQTCSQECLIVDFEDCGDGDLDPGEECDDGNNEDDDGCSASCTEEESDEIAINSYKVVCEKEEYLPNWGSLGSGSEPGEPDRISSTTAIDYVNYKNSLEERDVCWLEFNWYFEWGYDGEAQKQDGDHVGPASGGTGWNPFDTYTGEVEGYAQKVIQGSGNPVGIWVREILQENYIPFANPPGSLQTSTSAEMYCEYDIENYDNYDLINDASWIEAYGGQTYNCVAFNALIPEENGTVTVCKYNVDTEGLLNSWQFTLEKEGEGWEYVASGLSGDQSYDYPEGCVVFSDIELGNYRLSEELMGGWVRVTPEGEYIEFEVTPGFDNSEEPFEFWNEHEGEEPYCGDEVINGEEECESDGDCGEGYYCSDCSCYPEEGPEPYCGDGTCDEGESCCADCGGCGGSGPYCGDGYVTSGEECDDGNNKNGDGCDSSCNEEGGGSTPLCILSGTCGGGSTPIPPISTSTPPEEPEVLGEEGAPILTIAKTVNLEFANPGDTGVEYKIVVTNIGNLTAFNANLLDILPTGLTFSDIGGKEKNWELGDINPAEKIEITYSVDVAGDINPISFINTAEVSADNHSAVKDIASLSIREVEVLAATGFSINELILLLFSTAVLFGLGAMARKEV